MSAGRTEFFYSRKKALALLALDVDNTCAQAFLEEIGPAVERHHQQFAAYLQDRIRRLMEVCGKSPFDEFVRFVSKSDGVPEENVRAAIEALQQQGQVACDRVSVRSVLPGER